MSREKNAIGKKNLEKLSIYLSKQNDTKTNNKKTGKIGTKSSTN